MDHHRIISSNIKGLKHYSFGPYILIIGILTALGCSKNTVTANEKTEVRAPDTSALFKKNRYLIQKKFPNQKVQILSNESDAYFVAAVHGNPQPGAGSLEIVAWDLLTSEEIYTRKFRAATVEFEEGHVLNIKTYPERYNEKQGNTIVIDLEKY